MNDRDFFAQMAQLGQVEGSDKMQKRLDMMQATSMMGKTVDALRPMTDENSGGVNDIVTGEVVRMTVKNGERMLGIKEANGGIVEVRMENIREIRN
jgi:flagellar hook assembly protein FlgD